MVGFHVEGEERDKRNAEPENVRLTNVTANNENPKNGKEVNWERSETFQRHIL